MMEDTPRTRFAVAVEFPEGAEAGVASWVLTGEPECIFQANVSQEEVRQIRETPFPHGIDWEGRIVVLERHLVDEDRLDWFDELFARLYPAAVAGGDVEPADIQWLAEHGIAVGQ